MNSKSFIQFHNPFGDRYIGFFEKKSLGATVSLWTSPSIGPEDLLEPHETQEAPADAGEL